MFLEENADVCFSIGEELGISENRGSELIRITRSIEIREAKEGLGRTSHVLLGISARKDLSDLEKIVCSFIFSCMHIDSGTIGNKYDFSKLDMNTDCVVVAPSGMNKGDIMCATMCVFLEQLKHVPRSDAKNFCDKMSKLFAKMAQEENLEDLEDLDK